MREMEAILGGQIMLRTQDVVSDLLRLSAYARNDMANALNRMVLAAVLSILLLMAVITATFLTIMKSLVKPIAALRRGTEIVGAGDLDFRIGTDRGDEIGSLSRSFDAMAGKLKMSFTSVEKLQQEITERRKAEKNLRQTVRLNQILLDAFPCVALLLRPRTREIVVSNAAAIKVGAVPGDRCYSTWGQREAPCPWCLAPAAWDTDKKQHLEVEAGGLFWDAHWIPVSEDLYMHFAFDVTERKRVEVEKEKLQAQLQQAMKMEAVGRLAGGVAHDFNNLLTVITGYSELLLQKIAKESPMHEEVEQIKQAGERAASLTKQLLAFSRKQIIEPKVLDLNLLMADLGKMLVRLIGENIDLKTVHGKGLGQIKVDPGQFEQVLINLAVNARDAMPDGGTLLIETANVDLDEEYCAQRPYQIHPGRFVRLAVSDTGCGMTEETSKHIFEPFFTTKATGEGTGLGLSMIYGAVKQSGGSIEAYSEVGKGTTIKIYLPRVEGEAVKPVKDDRPTVLPGGTERVLVVEDDDTVRNLCGRILERLGYKMMPARDGAEAIAVAQKYGDRIDLMLTDVVMPGMNGSELATQLVLHHPEMKVLFTSGYTDDAISRHGVLDEGVSFIGKPYTPLALARKVREVLGKA
jgi:signal transduction histidine kinase/HAMP domain-containing protein